MACWQHVLRKQFTLVCSTSPIRRFPFCIGWQYIRPHVRTDVSADEKLEWILTHGGLHETEAHHETYRFVALAYPEAGLEWRRRVIEAVLAFRWPREEDPDGEELRNSHNIFDWLHWIHSAAPQCESRWASPG